MRTVATDVSVRRAGPDDAPAVLAMMLAAFEEYREVLQPRSSAHDETVASVLAAMAEGGALLAYVGGELAGSGRYRLRENHMYVERLSVLPGSRGRGLAGAMLLECERIAAELGYREMRLSVRAALERNLVLYQRHGYVEYARAPHLRGPFDVVEMKKVLGSAAPAPAGGVQ